jgi:hypothetical protein
MPNILGGGGVNCLFGNIGSVIADAFQTAANKNQVQVAAQLFPVLRHAFD